MKKSEKTPAETLSATSPRPKIDDVAAVAGVSSATVSRVLNGLPRVREEVRERVKAAALQLGYLADGAARALASRKSHAIGAIVPTLKNSVFAQTIDAFHRRLEEHNYTLLLSSFEYDLEREFHQGKVMLEHGVDGLLLVGSNRKAGFQAILDAKQTPYVQAWVGPMSSAHPSIGYSNDEVAEQVVGYLTGMGHKTIGVVTAMAEHNDRVTARIQGLKKAIARRGLSLPEDMIVHCPLSVEDGRQALRQFQLGGTMPTAIIAGNDVLAYGLLFEAISQQLKVPDELSIVGHGDMGLAAHLSPALTTVRTPKILIGQIAADYLVSQIEMRNYPLPSNLPIELIVRGSTGPAPAPKPAVRSRAKNARSPISR